MKADTDHLVEFVNVQKTYDGEELVVKNLNLKIKSGEIPAVRFSRKIFLIETHNLENFINNKSVQVRTI